MPGCITEDYKDLLVGLIIQELGAENLVAVVKAIPLCALPEPLALLPEITIEETKRAKAKKKAEARRRLPEPWQAAEYKGALPSVKEKFEKLVGTYDNPTELAKKLGLKIKGARNMVHVFERAGFKVSGDGPVVKGKSKFVITKVGPIPVMYKEEYAPPPIVTPPLPKRKALIPEVAVKDEAGKIIRWETAEGKPVPKELWPHHSNPDTGTCYEDAWRYLIKEEEGELVHGSLQLSKEGKRVNHAWVELPTGYIYEPQTDSFFEKPDFERMFSPKEDARYTVTEAAIMLAHMGKHGPWSSNPLLRPHMKLGVREDTGVAWQYHEATSPKELKKLGIRPATEEEIKKYFELKPLFEARKIEKIQLAEPRHSSNPISQLPPNNRVLGLKD